MNEIEWVNKEFRILDHVPTGTFALRKDFVILFWNRRLEDWTQMSREQVVGLDIGEHYPHLKEPRYASRLQAVFEGGPPTIFSSQFHQQILPLQRRDGSPQIQHTTVTAVKSFEDDQFYALFVLEDVTEASQRIQAYGRLARQLQEVNNELEGFAYSVAHDLRAPLRAVQGFSNALLEDYGAVLDEIGKEYAHFLVESAQQMDKLIQDLLTYSRLVRADIQLQPVLIESAFVNAKYQLTAAIRESEATVTNSDLQVEIMGNNSILVQVLANLLGNALKFVEPGVKPQVHVYLEEYQSTIRLWVVDNGIGIAPEHRERIFKVFERLHGVETYPGTGIGLALVHKGIERLGGTVGLESEIGEGTKFWIELPKATRRSS